MRWKVVVFSIGVGVLVCASGALAMDRLVPSVYPTIQAGIDAAQPGEMVVLAEAVYTGPGNRDLDFGGKAITVRSADPNDPNVVAATVIDCNGTQEDPHRGFYFHNGEDTNSVVDGLTIQNGNAFGELISGYGGGMLNIDTSPTVSKCIFRNNYATYGGGISNWYEYAKPAVANCIFKDNEASEYGGAIDNTWASPSISNCLFVGNEAKRGGGVSSHEFFSYPTIASSVFCGNSATQYGGGMYYDFCSATVTNCTFSNNTADYGSSVCNTFAADPTFINCIIWNDSENGDEVYNDLAWPSVTYCDVRGGYPGLGNINADPCFVDPSNGDYHLKSEAGRWDPNSESWVIDSNTSLCIDAGNPGCLVGDEPDPNGNRINMGAYGGTAQASKSPDNWAFLADLTNDRQVDYNDVGVFVNYWLEAGGCVPGDLDRSGLVDAVDFALFASQWSGMAMAEPSIDYQIEACNPEAGASSLAEQSQSTRFTVTVEGQYIHFEDIMVANCCPDELEMEMTVEGSLITIHEIEYTIAGGCRCMCDFPVTATLGPFEPGTYTVEVYEDHGGFIGSTTVTIGPGP